MKRNIADACEGSIKKTKVEGKPDEEKVSRLGMGTMRRLKSHVQEIGRAFVKHQEEQDAKMDAVCIKLKQCETCSFANTHKVHDLHKAGPKMILKHSQKWTQMTILTFDHLAEPFKRLTRFASRTHFHWMAMTCPSHALSIPKDGHGCFPKELELDSVPASLAEKQRKLDPTSQSKMLLLIATLWMMTLDTDDAVLEPAPAGTVHPDCRVVKACIRPGTVSQGTRVLKAKVIFVEDHLDFTKLPRNNKHTNSKKPRVSWVLPSP
eukprot:jgi/Bigna1/75971/fgenesh1_pg.38_\